MSHPAVNCWMLCATQWSVAGTTKKEETMKRTILALSCAALVAGTAVGAEVITTTRSTGTLHEFVPGETIVVKESTGPVSYRYSKDVTYVTRSGRVLPAERARTYMRVGRPLTLHYDMDDDVRFVKKVEIDDDDDRKIEVEDADDDD